MRSNYRTTESLRYLTEVEFESCPLHNTEIPYLGDFLILIADIYLPQQQLGVTVVSPSRTSSYMRGMVTTKGQLDSM